MSRSADEVSWREGAYATLFYGALTLVMAYPLTLHPATRALSMGADTNLLLWLLQWDVHGLVSHPLSMFDANIFHPFRHSLAFAENVIGSALLAAPVIWITGNPVLALNVVSLLSCVLCGVGAYLLARRVGVGLLGAALGGLIFAFAPPRFFRIGQLHLTTVQWMPFTLVFVHRYLDSGRRRDLWGACGFFALQALTSGHGAVFTAVSVAGLVAWRLAFRQPFTPLKWLRDLSLPGTLLVVLAVAVFLPYRAAQAEMGLRRGLGESYSFSPNAASFLASPTHLHAAILSRLTDGWVLREAMAFLFPGYLTIVLALAGVSLRLAQTQGEGASLDRRSRQFAHAVESLLLAGIVLATAVTMTGGFRFRWGSTVVFSARQSWRPWALCALLVAVRAALLPRVPLALTSRLARLPDWHRRRSAALRQDTVAFYSVLAMFSIWLSLGPPFVLYSWVYDWPGFSFIRVPSRFSLITILCAAVLAGWGFDRLTSRLALGARRTAAAVAAAILVAEFYAAPLAAIPYRADVPAIDRWLDSKPKPFVVAEVPVVGGVGQAERDQRQSLYMLHSTAHWQKTVHGYSGLQPALHAELYTELVDFPDENSLIGLTSLGVTYVVVHGDLYPPGERPQVDARLARYHAWLTLERTDGPDRVYSLRRPPADVLLRQRHADFAAAMVGGDPAVASRFYADNALLVPADGSLRRGRAAVEAWLARELGGNRIALDPDAAEFEVAGDEAYVTGRFTTAGDSTEGRRAAAGDKYVEVWRLAGGQWRLAYHTLLAEPAGLPR